MDPFAYRKERWLRAWRWDHNPDRPWNDTWVSVYDGLFTNNQVVRDYTRAPWPPYFIVEVWERKPEETRWTRVLRKGNWLKGTVMVLTDQFITVYRWDGDWRPVYRTSASANKMAPILRYWRAKRPPPYYWINVREARVDPSDPNTWNFVDVYDAGNW